MAKHVLLTGQPGVGKTTAVKKVCEALRKKEVSFHGFYTEEVRQNRQRIGFDIVTTDGKRSILARAGGDTRGPKVGKYTVNVQSFESLALQTLNTQGPAILVIDEIGKMELFSQQFQTAVCSALTKPQLRLLATIPLTKSNVPYLVEEIRNRKDVILITVTEQNRDDMVSKVLEFLAVESN